MSKAVKVCPSADCGAVCGEAKCPLCKEPVEYIDSVLIRCKNCQRIFRFDQLPDRLCPTCKTFHLVFIKG